MKTIIEKHNRMVLKIESFEYKQCFFLFSLFKVELKCSFSNLELLAQLNCTKNQKFYQLHDAVFNFLIRCLVHILLIKLGIFFDQMVALCEK